MVFEVQRNRMAPPERFAPASEGLPSAPIVAF
jgi:hypothetical protein